MQVAMARGGLPVLAVAALPEPALDAAVFGISEEMNGAKASVAARRALTLRRAVSAFALRERGPAAVALPANGQAPVAE